MFKSFTGEITNHKYIYFILAVILGVAFFVRSYRLDQLIGFYYDQGRDAKIIWDLWHSGEFFLIGPTTGLPGIFLGPFYYYLIAPFYFLGRGDPVWPATFLAFTSTVATFMLYYLGWKMHTRITGLLAATIGALSYYLVLSSRWLSNPTPLLLTSMLLVFCMWKVANKATSLWWVAIALLVGISLHFEAASAVFFIPVILVFSIWQRKNFPTFSILLISVFAFISTLLPQVIFDFRNDHILLNNFIKTFFENKSFSHIIWEVLEDRKNLFWGVFSGKLLLGSETYTATIVLISGCALLVNRKLMNKTGGVTLLLIFLIVPLIGYVTFQGNHGNVYDYYLTGLYLPFILLFSLGIGSLWNSILGKLVISLFFIFFFMVNGELLKNYLIVGVDRETHITLGNEVQAVDWVLDDSNMKPFNQDVYVPPVIPHSYDYLFLWRAYSRCGESLCNMKLDEQIPLLYTLYEVDPPHPERLDAWLARQKGIGVVDESAKFGGITIERRHRI